MLETIQRLRAGDLRASMLDSEDRRACVEHLTAEGYSVAETAQVLGVSDRTISRDRWSSGLATRSSATSRPWTR